MKKQSGFTLLELLIAMTLMGLVLVIVYGGLNLGMRSWEAGEARAEQTNELRLVEDFVRSRLSESVGVFREDPDQGSVVAFEGDESRLTLVTPMLAYLGLGGLYLVRFEVVEGGEGARFSLRWQPYRPGSLELAEGEETVLVDRVTGVRWTYFGSGEPNAEPQWHDRWPNPFERPSLVRLDLEVGGEPWPALVAVLPDGLYRSF